MTLKSTEKIKTALVGVDNRLKFIIDSHCEIKKLTRLEKLALIEYNNATM